MGSSWTSPRREDDPLGVALAQAADQLGRATTPGEQKSAREAVDAARDAIYDAIAKGEIKGTLDRRVERPQPTSAAMSVVAGIYRNPRELAVLELGIALGRHHSEQSLPSAQAVESAAQTVRETSAVPHGGVSALTALEEFERARIARSESHMPPAARPTVSTRRVQ